MICSKCGRPYDELARFCAGCGVPLSTPVDEMAPRISSKPAAKPDLDDPRPGHRSSLFIRPNLLGIIVLAVLAALTVTGALADSQSYNVTVSLFVLASVTAATIGACSVIIGRMRWLGLVSRKSGGVVLAVAIPTCIACSMAIAPTSVEPSHGQSVSLTTASTSTVKPTVVPTVTPFDVVDLATTWQTTSRGFTSLDGGLWVPNIGFTIKNNLPHDSGRLCFKAVFVDASSVIKGDDAITCMDSIPANFSRGPIFLQGSVGYTTDLPFLGMASNKTTLWHYTLYSGSSYAGPWEQLESGPVELPPGYQGMVKQ